MQISEERETLRLEKPGLNKFIDVIKTYDPKGAETSSSLLKQRSNLGRDAKDSLEKV